MSITDKIIEVPYDSKEEEEKLENMLKEVKELNQLKADLSNIIELQTENIDRIEKASEKTSDIAIYANNELESASGRKFKMLPVCLGSGIGLLVTLPLTLGLGLSAGAVGGIVAGGSVVGGIMGKNLDK